MAGASAPLVIAQQKTSRKKEESEEQVSPAEDLMREHGVLKRVPLICRIDTYDELDYFKNGGILQYVLRHLAA